MHLDIKKDFPILSKFHYLDSAATSLKPVSVVQAVREYYMEYPANVHRGVYKLSERATDEYEKSREATAELFNSKPDEVVFTRNTTECINQLANVFAGTLLNKGDVVLITEMEHHSNLLPWLMLKQKIGIKVGYVKLDGPTLDYSDFESKIHSLKPKVVSFVHASNVLGTINDAKKILDMCSDLGITTVMDCAQSAPHMRIDFRKLGVDYVAFSAHKMLGPTGVGILIGKSHLLESLPPFFGGGSMVSKADLQSFIPAEIPQKFEAGTPNIAGVIGFGAAVRYIKQIGYEQMHRTETNLLEHTLKRHDEVSDFVELHSNTDLKNSLGIFTFSVKGVHPHDVAAILDESNVCVRGGHHCAQPLHNLLGADHTVRASYYFYNSKSDVDALFSALQNVKKVFSL